MADHLAQFSARYRGTEYPCTLDVSLPFIEVRLHHDRDSEGFSEVEAGRYVQVVPLDDCEAVVYRYAVCRWRELDCIIVEESESRVLVEYTGGDRAAALQAGLEMIERGVYRRWVSASDIRGRMMASQILKSPEALAE